MPHARGPALGHTGPGPLARAIEFNAAAAPLSDQLVVIAPDGTVAMLNPSARRLWEALQAGCSVDDLVEASVEESELPEEVARTNIARALRSWRTLGLIGSAPHEAELEPPTTHLARVGGRTLEQDAVYAPGDRPVRVRCDDRVLAEVIDTACQSCRVRPVDGALATIDVVEEDGWFAVRADAAVLARADDLTANRALARHRCLTALLEAARRPRQWIGILHASAVGADGRCMLFSGPKGSGKSTLAAALVAAGLEFVADDYAPLERASWRVCPVPYAPGIKRGSWRALRRHYPDLYARPVHELAGLQIRYLELEPSRMAPLSRGLPVAALVFPHYRAGAGFERQPMTATEALAGLCHARSLLDRQPDVVAETLRWVESVPAYRLVYDDLARATEWVLSWLAAR